MDIPKMLLGTFQNDNFDSLLGVVNAMFDINMPGFDTAPSYGTEEQLGRAINICAKERGLSRDKYYISNKIDAWQMQKGNVDKYVESALKKMNTDYFDMLLIHWPIEQYMEKSWKVFESLKSESKVLNIGICNVRVRHLKRMKEQCVIPDAIQIERHPLRTCDDEMKYCISNNITVMAYSPLCRMHSDIRKSEILNSIAKKYNKNIGQVILRWHIDTCSVPVFMSQKVSRVKDNADVFDFSLSQSEITAINSLNQNYKIFLESWGCPGF